MCPLASPFCFIFSHLPPLCDHFESNKHHKADLSSLMLPLKNATPSSLWPDSFAGEMLSTSQNPLMWSPVTRLSSFPKGVPLLSNANFLLNGYSNSDNLAHFLLDDLIPSVTALSLFGLSLDSGQLLSQNGCRRTR